MGWGVATDTPCPGCGLGLVRVDYDPDPPPIPMRVPPGWHQDGERWLVQCPRCDVDLEDAYQAKEAA